MRYNPIHDIPSALVCWGLLFGVCVLSAAEPAGVTAASPLPTKPSASLPVKSVRVSSTYGKFSGAKAIDGNYGVTSRHSLRR